MSGIGAQLAALVQPLESGLSTPDGLDRLLRDLGLLRGRTLALPVPPALAALATGATSAVEALTALDDPQVSAAEKTAALITELGALFEAIRTLSTTATGGLAPPFDRPDLLPALAERLPAYLLLRWLRGNHGEIYDALALAGIVAAATSADSPGTPARFDFARLLDVAADPATTLAESLADDLTLLLGPLRRLFDRRGVTVAADDTATDGQQAVALEPSAVADDSITLAAPPAAAGRTPGASPVLIGQIAADGKRLLVSVAGLDAGAGAELGTWSLDTSGGPGVAAFHLGTADVQPADAGTLDAAQLALTGTPDTPWALLGMAGATRLELASVTFAVEGENLRGVPDVALRMQTSGLRLVLAAGDADSFVARLLGSSEVAADMPLALRWSAADGLTVDGGFGLSISIPTSITMGPVTVVGLTIALSVDDELHLAVTSSFNADLGPLALVVDDIGMQLELASAPAPGIPLGPVAARLAFQPPHGIGVGIDVGVVSGGGYLFIDVSEGSYSGVLDLRILSVGVTAFAIVDTEAAGVDGWSLFFALYIEVPSIQLGFGFTLTGVGGLAGVNRGIDTAALQAAVVGGGLDAILFPDDPIVNAPIIIDHFQTIFPPVAGQYVFGPVVRIGWGTPSLIEASVGIAVSLPDPIVIAVLGTVGSTLPTADVDLVALRLDVAGVIDFGAGTLSIDAGLHDSYIAYYALSGGMSLRAAFGPSPSFLMALGGSHPRFPRPAGFPDQARLSLAVSAAPVIDIHFGCYFAITSNTVQFGAEFGLTAQVEGFGVDGGTEFDALVFFHPFALTTHLGFHVAITAAGVDLAGVWLDLTVSGPNPWHVIGDARFKVLGIETSVHLNEVIGGTRSEPELDSADLRTQMLAALSRADSWTAPAAPSPGVLLASSTSDTTVDDPVAAMPDATITVSQKVAPLGITLEKAGDLPVASFDRFDLEAADSTVKVTGTATDWFPPGFYLSLSPAEQLIAPSFEQLPSGVLIGGGAGVAGPDRTASLEFEQILRDPELGEEGMDPGPFHLDSDPRAGIATSLASAAANSAAFASATFTAAPTAFPIASGDVLTTTPAAYAVVNDTTGTVRLAATSWTAARQSDVAAAPKAVLTPTWQILPQEQT